MVILLVLGILLALAYWRGDRGEERDISKIEDYYANRKTHEKGDSE